MTKNLYNVRAKITSIKWNLENFIASINKVKPSNKKLFIHIPKNAGMTIRRSDALKDKIMVSEPLTCLLI